MQETYYSRCPLETRICVNALRTSFSRSMVPGDSSGGEFHNFWEIALVLEGELTIATDQTVFTVPTDGLLLLPPMAMHWMSNRTKEQIRFLILSFDAQISHVPENTLYLLTKEDVRAFRQLEQMIATNFDRQQIRILRPKPNRPWAAQEAKSRLELLLVCLLSGNAAPRQSINADYTRIVQFLNRNLHRSLTLEDIARELNMSVSNLKKLFSRYSDTGVIHYFTRCKIGHAITLLRGGHSVKETADMLGYSSQSVFCTAFKTVMGFPPSQIRTETPIAE